MTEDTGALPSKLSVTQFLLREGSVFVYLDPRIETVEVPDSFRDQPQLVLQIGHNMPVPITDLEITDAGWSGTLSFNRSPFHCVVPWEAVYTIASEQGKGMMWPESVPKEIAQEIARETGDAPPPPLMAEDADNVVDLDAARAERHSDPSQLPDNDDSPPTGTDSRSRRGGAHGVKRRPPYLKLIK